MRKARRTAGLQGAGGVAAETGVGNSLGEVMPGCSNGTSRGEDLALGRFWCKVGEGSNRDILLGVGRTGRARGS